MSNSQPIETKRIHLRPGFHLLTYIDAVDLKHTPIVNIAVPMGQLNCQVSMMFLKPHHEGCLTEPGEVVIVRVIGEPCELLMGVFTSIDCTSAEIKLKTEYLLEASDEIFAAHHPQVEAESTLSTPELDSSGEKTIPLAFSGHVQWQGDVKLGAGEALGNPEKNWRIECFSMHWADKPADVDIEYRCYVKTLGESPVASINGLVGTKARAMPITALAVQLTGVAAENYELNLQVIFSETGLRPVTANGELIWGLHKDEYLVGIRGVIKQKPIVDQLDETAESNDNMWGEVTESSANNDTPVENTWTKTKETRWNDAIEPTVEDKSPVADNIWAINPNVAP